MQDSFAARLQARLEHLGMSQADLGRALGWKDGSQINRWIKQGALPEGATLLRLPGILRCSGHWLLTGEGLPERPEEDDRAKLEAIRRILSGDAPEALPTAEAATPRRGGKRFDLPELQSRFLDAIAPYSDLQVDRICGLSHETVRSYRAGEWPERGPNSATRDKMYNMIAHREAEIAGRIDSGEVTPLISGVTLFVEDREASESFTQRWPNHGAIWLAEEALEVLRRRGQVTIYDELCWVGYKRRAGYDPEAADKPSFGDLDMNLDDFVGRLEGAVTSS